MKLRAYIKIIKVLLATIFYVTVIVLRRVAKGKDLNHASKIRKTWAKYAIKAFGIKVETYGQMPKENALVISNHRSLIDPVVQLNYFYALPVAKAEIAKYPLIGYAAEATGVVFLERENSDSRMTVRNVIKEKVNSGFNILLYPEGTVGAGKSTKLFSKGSFEIAASEDLSIVPVAIEYSHPDNLWQPGVSMMSHFVKSLSHKEIKVKLYIGDLIKGPNSWALMSNTQNWINEKLAEAQQTWSNTN